MFSHIRSCPAYQNVTSHSVPDLYTLLSTIKRIFSDWLRAGQSGDRIPVGGEIFRTCPDRPWGPQSLLYNGYRVFLGGKLRPGRDVDPF